MHVEGTTSDADRGRARRGTAAALALAVLATLLGGAGCWYVGGALGALSQQGGGSSGPGGTVTVNSSLAAEIIAAEFGKTMTDLYTTASLLANFRGAPLGEGTAIPRGGRKYTGNLGVAGVWPESSPPPAHDELHEHEVRHAVPAGIS